MIIQKHFSYYSTESRKLIHSLPCWKADLKPTMDYKVRLKVKSRSLLKVEGGGNSCKPPRSTWLRKRNRLQSWRRNAGVHLQPEHSHVQWAPLSCSVSAWDARGRSWSRLIPCQNRNALGLAAFAPIWRKADRVGESPNDAGRWGLLCLHLRRPPNPTQT